MSVHKGAHRVGKLPLRVLKLCREDHKNKLNLKDLESEYYWDLIMNFQYAASNNMAQLYAMFRELGSKTPIPQGEVHDLCMHAAYLQTYGGDNRSTQEPSYEDYFKQRPTHF